MNIDIGKNTAKAAGFLLAATLAAMAPGAVLAGSEIDTEYDRRDFDNPTAIDNPLWPLTPGMVHTYAYEDGECEVNTVYVADHDNPSDTIAPHN